MLNKISNYKIARNNLKHEGYQKVKCITRSLGIEITEARGDGDVSPSSHLAGATPCWSGIESQGSSKCHKGHRILLKPSHKEVSPQSTMGPFRAVIERPNMYNLGANSKT
jgi:hypothetical protein